MMGSEQYRRQAAVTGMTRVEMLLALYDRAILHLQTAEEAHAKGDAANSSLEQFQAQKMIFGLFAGLKTDDSEIANNIGRLLGFVMDCLVKKDFAPAEKTLGNLRDTFEKIREEAMRLEQSGTISSLSQSHAVEVTV